MNEVGATVVFIYTDYTYDIIKKKEEEEEEEDFFRVFLSFVVDHDILHTCPALVTHLMLCQIFTCYFFDALGFWHVDHLIPPTSSPVPPLFPTQTSYA